MDFNKIEAEERHIFKLWTLCRVCGQAGEKLQYCLDNYAELLELLYGIYLSEDDPAVHPQMVCQKCRLVLQQYLKKSPKSKKPPLPELYTFYKHSDMCFVCDRASGLLPKRKLSIDTGDSASQAKIARHDNDQSIAHSEGEKDTEDGTGSKKGNSDELSEQDTVRANVLLQAIQGAIADETLVADSEEMIDEPEQDGFTKYVYLNMIRRFKARNIKGEKARQSIDINRFNQKNFAYAFLTCSLCKRLPLKPVSTECKHIFCEACISDWLNFGNVCPKCEEVIVELSDASEQLNHLYMLLDAPCSFASKGCEAKLNPFEINGHEKDCPYNDRNDSSNSSEEEEEEEKEEKEEHQEVQRKPSAPRKRRSLRYVTCKLATSRVKDMVEFLDKTCKQEREDKIDVLFYMLREALTEAEDARATTVNLLWQHKAKAQHARGRGRPPSAAKLASGRQSRRKGMPRKRGRPRKVPVEELPGSTSEEDEEAEEEGDEAKGEEDEESGDQEEDEEEEIEEEEDLEEKDATWKPQSTIRRRQVRNHTEVAEEKDDKNAPKEHDYSKDNEAFESKVQITVQQVQDTGTCNTSENVAMQVVMLPVGGDEQPHQDSTDMVQ
ncbi:E3 ubiquitin-protein ligase RNF146-like [Patiria miniata]|uniref:RING-type domain-containing protein n=1 Tax=Patiria miniata TaxID=46514 RepID=A0A913Z432_PATMI|nr:E3 ubiquitin-protein ligase RNF146-like [Patiria miniata]